MKLNYKDILEYQQNRDPYLMIDFVENLIPGKLAEGYKDLKLEWFFKVHWKNDPNMPGMLQIEALVQMGALTILSLPDNKGKIVYLSSANDLNFKKKVIPGDRLLIKTKLLSFKRGVGILSGEGYVLDVKVCSASFRLILPDQLNKFSVNKKN